MAVTIIKKMGLKVTRVDVEPLPNGEYPYVMNQIVLSTYCYFDRPCEVYLKGRCYFSNVDEFSAPQRNPQP
jgi:hypothetical protein